MIDLINIYDLDDVLDFGKFAGNNVEDIILENSQYIRWLVGNTPFKLTDRADEFLRVTEFRAKSARMRQQRPSRRRRKGHQDIYPEQSLDTSPGSNGMDLWILELD